jgi:hypothetical protein
VIGGRVVDHLEVHAGLVGRGLHVFECDVLHFDVNLGLWGDNPKRDSSTSRRLAGAVRAAE